MTIQEALYAALAANPDLTELVGDRIFPGQIPDDEAPTPWLYYAVPESTPFDQLDGGPQDVESQVEFHVLADRYSVAVAIVQAVKDVLKDYRDATIRRSFWAGTSEDTTEDGYHHAARFTIGWVEAA